MQIRQKTFFKLIKRNKKKKLRQEMQGNESEHLFKFF